MKKVQSKQHPFLLVLMLLFLVIIAQKAKSLTPTSAGPAALEGCNASRIGDCLADEEFLMESETSRRFLAADGKSTTPGALNQGKPFCNRDAYGNCIGRPNKFYDDRPCNYANTCGRNA